MAGVGPAVAHGAVEAFDLAVGLGPVGPGLLHGDAELVAGGVPVAGAVAASVVGQDSFDADTALGIPGHGPGQDAGRGLGGLVVVDFGVSDAGVVVDHGVTNACGICLAYHLLRVLPVVAALFSLLWVLPT